MLTGYRRFKTIVDLLKRQSEAYTKIHSVNAWVYDYGTSEEIKEHNKVIREGSEELRVVEEELKALDVTFEEVTHAYRCY